MRRMRLLLANLGLMLALGAGAQESPVRILVGFPPGGGSDLIARLDLLSRETNSTCFPSSST